MELLKKLYEVHSPSNSEKKLKRVIRRWIYEEDGKVRGRGVATSYDNEGNMYITKGKLGEGEYYPCVVAHLDQVQRTHSSDFKAMWDEEAGLLFGYSKNKKCFEGLGADDKNGIWIALKCLEKFTKIKIAFFVGEEIGCVGSGKANLDFFKDVRYVLECDRRGSSDLITSISGLDIASKDFVKDVTPIAERYGYKEASGMMTDVLELSERGVGVSCINMSCGYYDPHTDNEFTIWEDLVNSLCFVEDIIHNMEGRYPHEVSRYSYGSYGGYYGSGNRSNHYSFHDDIYGEDAWDGYSYDDATGTWRPNKELGKLSSDSVITLRASDYADVESFIDQFLYENMGTGLYPEDLYPYIASDLDTFGMGEIDFLEYTYNNYGGYYDYED